MLKFSKKRNFSLVIALGMRYTSRTGKGEACAVIPAYEEIPQRLKLSPALQAINNQHTQMKKTCIVLS